jgi:hypothetical protein
MYRLVISAYELDHGIRFSLSQVKEIEDKAMQSFIALKHEDDTKTLSGFLLFECESMMADILAGKFNVSESPAL